jgi:hypothetical protein
MPCHILPIGAVLLQLYLQTIILSAVVRASTSSIHRLPQLLFSVGNSFVGKVRVHRDRSHAVNLCIFSVQLAVLLNDIRIKV